jgi:hypothetical protein
MSDFSSDLFWNDVSGDHERIQRTSALIHGKVAVAAYWPFLSSAYSERDFENRLSLSLDRIAGLVSPDVLDEVLSSLRDDYRAVTGASKKDDDKSKNPFAKNDDDDDSDDDSDDDKKSKKDKKDSDDDDSDSADDADDDDSDDDKDDNTPPWLKGKKDKKKESSYVPDPSNAGRYYHEYDALTQPVNNGDSQGPDGYPIDLAVGEDRSTPKIEQEITPGTWSTGQGMPERPMPQGVQRGYQPVAARFDKEGFLIESVVDPVPGAPLASNPFYFSTGSDGLLGDGFPQSPGQDPTDRANEYGDVQPGSSSGSEEGYSDGKGYSRSHPGETVASRQSPNFNHEAGAASEFLNSIWDSEKTRRQTKNHPAIEQSHQQYADDVEALHHTLQHGHADADNAMDKIVAKRADTDGKIVDHCPGCEKPRRVHSTMHGDEIRHLHNDHVRCFGKSSAKKTANQYIKQQGGKWVILQKGTGKVLSHHDSEEKANESFAAMEMNKHSFIEAIPELAEAAEGAEGGAAANAAGAAGGDKGGKQDKPADTWAWDMLNSKQSSLPQFFDPTELAKTSAQHPGANASDYEKGYYHGWAHMKGNMPARHLSFDPAIKGTFENENDEYKNGYRSGWKSENGREGALLPNGANFGNHDRSLSFSEALAYTSGYGVHTADNPQFFDKTAGDYVGRPDAFNPTGRGDDEFKARTWNAYETTRPMQNAEDRNVNTPVKPAEPMRTRNVNSPNPGENLRNDRLEQSRAQDDDDDED